MVMDYQPKFETYKLMLGIPAIENPPWWFVMAFNSIAFPVNFCKRTHVCFGREVGDARNLIVEAALEENCEYILFLDDDVIMPPNIFTRLYSQKKDIISALYTTKSVPSYPLLFKTPSQGCYHKWKLGETVKVWGCGMGATLINTRVFREGRIKKPFFKTTKLEAVRDPQSGGWHYRSGTEDLYFLDKVKDAGYEVFVDTSVQCEHFDRSMNRMYPLGGFDEWYKQKDWKT